eukprot:357704-Chlamydomonas_euryale.AAC.6
MAFATHRDICAPGCMRLAACGCPPPSAPPQWGASLAYGDEQRARCGGGGGAAHIGSECAHKAHAYWLSRMDQMCAGKAPSGRPLAVSHGPSVRWENALKAPIGSLT